MPQGAKLPFPTFPEFTELKLEHKDVYKKFAPWLDGVRHVSINLDSDFGLDLLRSLKLSLGATMFRRFHTVRPAKEFKPS